MFDKISVPIPIKDLIIDEIEVGPPLGVFGEGIAILQPLLKSPVPQIIEIEGGVHIL
jgi:hypothetical protein